MNSINSLVIGSSSQLAHYFPEEYERISSDIIRNNYPLPLNDEYYDRVFITIAEQRLYTEKDFETYIETNYTKTLKLIEFCRKIANFVIVYGSCELWNKRTGPIELSDKFDYDLHSPYTGYCISKHMLANKIHDSGMNDVFMIHPFNFNSPYRKPEFLFSKIFDSIINKKKIEIGNTHFYRDLVHPKYVVERSILSRGDELVGSGELTHVNDFIRMLYIKNGLDFDEYVTQTMDDNQKSAIYLKSEKPKYTTLLEDTLTDIRKFKI